MSAAILIIFALLAIEFVLIIGLAAFVGSIANRFAELDRQYIKPSMTGDE